MSKKVLTIIYVVVAVTLLLFLFRFVAGPYFIKKNCKLNTSKGPVILINEKGLPYETENVDDLVRESLYQACLEARGVK